ncbi:MAG: glutamate-1-semialdehyde-2,1-aminomutase [Acidobacteria bacterium]|nr:glutamate-1-semialdehyde-2,1-aminomutase [Acidobacteriota bacterium]
MAPPSKKLSAHLFAKAKQILPGGVNSPVRAFSSVGGRPPFIRRARGARIVDVDGRSYIDFVMSWGPLIHGHAPAGLIKILAETAARGTSFGAPTAQEVELGLLVQQLMPSLSRVRFVNSGTEATISALRLARAATKRNRVIKFAGCYHGHGDPFLVQAGSGATTLGVPTSPGVSPAVATDTLVARYNDLSSVERLFRAHRASIAALIVEPVAGNMGVVGPILGFLEGLRSLCDQYGALLIFDEVISGFRLSPGGAQKHFGVKPDLTCLGKIIGGGLPVGAYGGRRDLMEQVAPVGPVYQAGTLSGNPLAMAAGHWALSNLSPDLYTHLDKLGRRLASGLAEAARQANLNLQVNAFGSVLTPFFIARPVRNYSDATQADTNAYAKFFRGMLTRGIYLPPSQFEGWFLSAAHTTRHVDQAIDAAHSTMRAMRRQPRQ